MNNTVLTNGATTNKLNGGIEMTNVQILGAQVKKELAEARVNGLAPVLATGIEKVLKGVLDGTRSEEEIQLCIAALKMNKRNAIIDTPDLLTKFAKVLKAKEYITVLSVEVKRDKFGKYTGIVSTTPAPIGRAYSKHTKEASTVVPFGNSGFQTITENSFAPFVKDYISIKFDSTDDLKVVQDDGIYVLYAERKTMACMYNRELKVWVDITNGVQYSKDELKLLAKQIRGDLRLQKAFVYSPSDVRNFSFACKDVTKVDDRDEYLNYISNGAWDRVKSKVEKMIANGEDESAVQLYILKSMPRFGQLKAGSVNLGEIQSWGYLQESFKTACGETVDGTGYLRASYVAKVFSNVLGMTVAPAAVVGMFLQARPDLQKGAYEVLPDNVFDFMLGSMYNESKFVVFGSKAKSMKPVMIVDANVVKVESDYTVKDICLELLEIAGCSDANLSKQAFEKPLYADKKAAMEYALELGQDYMTDRFVNQFLEPKAKIPTIGEVKKNYAPDLTLAIAPQMITQSRPLFKSNLSNAVQSFVNSIDKLRYSIPGNNVRLTSDAAEIILGKKGREFAAIKYGEVYMPAAVEYFRRLYKAEAAELAKEKGLVDEEAKKFVLSYVDKKVNETKICMIKYPSMGPKEFYLANVLTLRTIYARINRMAITEEEKKILKDYYKATGKSVAKLPAVKLVMFQCAGLDYDYDGAEFIYDQKYVGILDKPGYKNEATLIASMKEIQDEYELIHDEVAVALNK